MDACEFFEVAALQGTGKMHLADHGGKNV